MSDSDKELENQILEAGEKLVDPPSSVDDLLSLLDVSSPSPLRFVCLCFLLLFFFGFVAMLSVCMCLVWISGFGFDYCVLHRFSYAVSFIFAL